MSRADLMYRTLRAADGAWATRADLFSDAGRFYLTNNAASEVRAKFGVGVEHEIRDGQHCYRLAPYGQLKLVAA